MVRLFAKQNSLAEYIFMGLGIALNEDNMFEPWKNH